MTEYLMLFVGSADELTANLWPKKFYDQDNELAFALEDKKPARFRDGSDVIALTTWDNKVFAYIGLMRNVRLRAERRCLAFSSYDRFPCPIVVSDDSQCIHRPHLLTPNRGWNPGLFAYVDEHAFAAVERAAQDNTEIPIWLGVASFLRREKRS